MVRSGSILPHRFGDGVLSENAKESTLLRFWMLGEATGSWFSKECSSRPPDNMMVFR